MPNLLNIKLEMGNYIGIVLYFLISFLLLFITIWYLLQIRVVFNEQK